MNPAVIATITAAVSELNTDQRAAVVALSHTCATACPGSGKTKMLSVKAAFLLMNPEQSVAVVTFTKDSADELKHRTLGLFDPTDSATKAIKARLFAGTFHGHCFQMLKKVKKIDLKSILSDGESFDYARRILQKFDSNLDAGDLLRQIEMERTGIVVAGISHQAKLFAKEYIALMRRNKKIDFTDLVLDTLEGLESGAIPPLPVTHMLVDEFQDTDLLQYRWIRAHSKAGTMITIVGDDDQAIFGFRFAMGFEGMQRFAIDHQAERIVLGTNYRCHKEILDSARRLIVFNQDRVPKMLVAAKGPGGSVYRFTANNIAEEARLTAELFADFATADYSAAVIGRTNRSLLNVSAAMTAIGVPYLAPPAASVLDTLEARIFMDLISCVTQRSKRGVDHALAWAGMHDADLATLDRQFKGELLLINREMSKTIGVEEESLRLWNGFVRTFVRLQDQCAGHEPPVALLLEGIKTWMDGTGVYAGFSKGSEIVGCVKMIFESRRGSLQERLDSLRKSSSDNKDVPDERKVVLTTMHKSKGLEWDRVHVIRMEEGVCPTSGEATVQEERRLFYVAMTRARKCLSVSHTLTNPESRFLREAQLREREPT